MLILATTESDIFINLRQELLGLREHNVAANPRKTKLGVPQVEYVGHLISTEGTFFMVESPELPTASDQESASKISGTRE